MLKETVADVKSFVSEHRGIIYFVVIAYIVDRYVFDGAFSARLKGLFDKLLGKAEEKVAQ